MRIPHKFYLGQEVKVEGEKREGRIMTIKVYIQGRHKKPLSPFLICYRIEGYPGFYPESVIQPT
jgi:hypothetical protein